MAKVCLTKIVVLDNPSPFCSPFQFELTFECIEQLEEDLECKMIYVGSAESDEYDQVLDTIYVGPISEGKHVCVFQAPPPDVERIPEKDALGASAVLLVCSYRGQEFVRVGYYISNEYSDSELEIRENPPKPRFDKIVRNILAKPRLTRFEIIWAESDALTPPDAGDCNLGSSQSPSNSQISGIEFKDRQIDITF